MIRCTMAIKREIAKLSETFYYNLNEMPSNAIYNFSYNDGNGDWLKIEFDNGQIYISWEISGISGYMGNVHYFSCGDEYIYISNDKTDITIPIE